MGLPLFLLQSYHAWKAIVTDYPSYLFSELGTIWKYLTENKTGNLHKIRPLPFKHNEWDIPLPQILRAYQWIETNVFSIEKNEILSPSWIGKALE